LRIICMNEEARKSLERISGVPYKKGLSIFTGLSTPKVEYFTAIFNRVFLGERVTFDHSFKVEGEIKYLHVTMNPVYNKDGCIVMLTCFAKDVTENKSIAGKLSDQNCLL